MISVYQSPHDSIISSSRLVAESAQLLLLSPAAAAGIFFLPRRRPQSHELVSDETESGLVLAHNVLESIVARHKHQWSSSRRSFNGDPFRRKQYAEPLLMMRTRIPLRQQLWHAFARSVLDSREMVHLRIPIGVAHGRPNTLTPVHRILLYHSLAAKQT